VTDLRGLAERLLATYLPRTRPDAALLAGSTVTGGADEHSDVDLLLYYDALPTDDAIEAARAELGRTDLRLLAPRSEEGLLEHLAFYVTYCQVLNLAIAHAVA
jgi:predicted nucleotidyltransferase